MVAVHAATGRSLGRVARDPWARTLWVWALLEETGGLTRRAERFDLASLVRLAVLDGKAFTEEARRFQREIGPPQGPAGYPAGAVDAAAVAEGRARVVAQQAQVKTAQWTRRWPPERT